MDSQWAITLILAFGNIGNYLFAPPERKREAGSQGFTASLALLGSFCIARFVLAKLMVAEVSFTVALLLMLLASGLAFLIIGSITWRLVKEFLQR